MRMLVIVLFFALFAPSRAIADTWYLNGTAPGGSYQIWAFSSDGDPLSTSPAASAPSGYMHVAWPSAIKSGSSTTVLASIYSQSTGWKEISKWTTSDHLSFAYGGVVFTANVAEPHGIGPSAATIESSLADPWMLYYLVRGKAGPGPSIAGATSPDGVTWTRTGDLLTVSLPQESGGLSLSYVCKRAAGHYVMFYHGYSVDLTRGVAIVATSPSRTGPFIGKQIVLRYDNFSTAFAGSSGQDTGTVAVGESVPLNIPLVIVSGPNQQEVIVAKRQDGSRIWFDRPLTYSHSGNLYSAARNKVELSYAREGTDGTWTGIATLYGPAPGITAEYTTSVRAPSLNGPWTYVGDGLRFKPRLPAILRSTENPAPVVASPSCAN